MKYEEIRITNDEFIKYSRDDKEFHVLNFVVQMAFKRPLRGDEIKALFWILRGSCFDKLMVNHLVDYCLYAMRVKDVKDIFLWRKSGLKTVMTIYNQ